MVPRAACRRRVNQGVRGALVIPGFPLGTTAVSASRGRILRSSSAACKTQKWGSAAWVYLKGEAGENPKAGVVAGFLFKAGVVFIYIPRQGWVFYFGASQGRGRALTHHSLAGSAEHAVA